MIGRGFLLLLYAALGLAGLAAVLAAAPTCEERTLKLTIENTDKFVMHEGTKARVWRARVWARISMIY